MRFSRAKPVGSFRVYHPSTRRVTAHTETLNEARKDAAYWVKTTSTPFEIQERLPSGAWVTVDTMARETAARARASHAHATKTKPIPGVSKWHMTAGGSGAAHGKHGYTLHPAEGEYHITPYTTKFGRHAGYKLQFAGTHGRPRGSHGGLWHDLGSHSSPQKAASAAAAHYAKGFD